MKRGTKIGKMALVVILSVVFLITTLGTVQAGEFKIKPKGDKKIKIGVMDLISSISVAALANGFYRKWAKERGWDLQVFDLNVDYSKAQPTMDNMITAGYDAILVNWTDFKYYDQQIMKAYKAGIPVQGIACGNMQPGVISHGIAPSMPFGALSALYLATKIPEGSKILVYHDPRVGTSQMRFEAAQVVFKMYNITVKQELHYPGSGDPSQVSYEMLKNAILADTKKEIVGIWTHWEGYGISAARAAVDMGRNEIIVTTSDDSPNTYNELRNLPTLHATSGTLGLTWQWTGRLFNNLDKIFAGEPFKDQEVWFSVPYLVTKNTLPPPGYYYSDCGYEGRPPDFEVK
jgi:ABC-type sugar transport system substrate-binding protein